MPRYLATGMRSRTLTCLNYLAHFKSLIANYNFTTLSIGTVSLILYKQRKSVYSA